MNTGSNFRLTTIFLLSLSLAGYGGVTGQVHTVRADLSPCTFPPAIPCDPGPQWVPAGPMVDKILITTYSDINGELGALKANTIDLTDWSLSVADVPASCPAGSTAILCDSRFYVSSPISDTGMATVDASGVFSLDFNNANIFFGINFGFGKDTNPDNLRAINFRQGVAHLFSKQDIVATQFGILANATDNPLPAGQASPHSGLPFDVTTSQGLAGKGPYSYGGYSLQGVCGSGIGASNTGWDTLDAQFRAAGQLCKSAFKYGNDVVDSAGIVTASASNPDFCDAADHWIAAGLATGKRASDCSLAGFGTAALTTGRIVFIARRDDIPRFNVGVSLASRLCELINGVGVTTCSQISTGILPISPFPPCAPVCSTDVVHLDWHIYLSSWGVGSTPDEIWRLYNSQFAGQACGGTPANFGTDYVYFCNSTFDKYNSMVEFNTTTSGSLASLQIASEIFGNHTATIPLYSQRSQYAYVKGWTGVSYANGLGPPNEFALMNMWNQVPATVGTLRWGLVQGTSNPNPLVITSRQEDFLVKEVYDTLLKTNPYSPNDIFGSMVNQWQVLPPQPGDPPGTVSDVKFNLRNDIFFHDGRQVTASDVAFSWLAFSSKGGRLGPTVQGINGVRIQNDFNFVVNLNSNSVYALLEMGQIPILAQHLLAADTTQKCSTVGTLSCTLYPGADIADLVAIYQFIGSGPFVCLDPVTSQVGGKCTATGTGSVPAGSSILLTRNGFGQSGTANIAYFRGSAKYAQWEWADLFKHGTVDILDVSSAASCLGKPASTAGCTHWDTPAATITCIAAAGSCNASSLAGLGGNNGGTVTFIEIQQAFRWFGVSWNSPFSYASLSSTTGCGGSGCGAQAFPQTLYEGGIVYAVIP